MPFAEGVGGGVLAPPPVLCVFYHVTRTLINSLLRLKQERSCLNVLYTYPAGADFLGGRREACTLFFFEKR